ncbi:VWA domain-containing protein [Gilliamella sp. Pra-s65]|uniref:VWA domain-containing protein n=1 Tax=unclassified Gilliamella TaxID=2685620 RepID=UPI0013652513|nr:MULTISPECIES: VWA domain-containing protein [unclassified Gilliamella]MWN90444.1 VWA domain-containing protein [Gilliamella sp. Pra-s65]MWP47122.1 VWA domain-containing protein [Gilliamella sp. Pas-s27]MWP73457.1 VWA domain-containing protein [Gilliamella sp. Pra-s52]
MQRITRIIFDHNNTEKKSLLDQYHTLLALLKPHLTERTFSILAIPRLIDDNQYIAWHTDLEGQPILLSDINNESHKNKVVKKLQNRLNDIEQAVKLIPITDQQQALISSWLSRLKSLGNSIYVINDDPVIVNTFEDPVLPVTTPVPAIIPTSFWRWWHFLLLALFLIGLLGLLWYLFCPFAKPVITQPVEQTTPESTVAEPIVPPTKNDPTVKLEPESTTLENTTKQCITREEIANITDYSKMVMVFDNSASMTITLMESQAAIKKFLNANFYSMTQKQADAYEKRMTRLPNRLSSSKKVALSAIDKIQPEVNIALVTLTSCPAAHKTSFYSYENRDKLKNKINRLKPLEYNSATPLYNGIKQASKMLDGVNRDDYILVISDGEDNCTKANICTLANKIATQQPRLKINIVDIAGQHKIDCVAEKTGGKVYIAQSPTAIVEQMNNALSTMKISKPICE